MNKTGQVTKLKNSSLGKKPNNKRGKEIDSINDMFAQDDEGPVSPQNKVDQSQQRNFNSDKSTAKKVTQQKDEFIQFNDDNDNHDGQSSLQAKKPQSYQQSSSAIDTIFKKLKKGQDEYSKHSSRQYDSKKDNSNNRYNDNSYNSRKDKDRSRDYYQDQYREEERVDRVPWMSEKTASISSSLVRAHNEIIEFVNYIIPTKESHRIRERSLER